MQLDRMFTHGDWEKIGKHSLGNNIRVDLILVNCIQCKYLGLIVYIMNYILDIKYDVNVFEKKENKKVL